MRAKLTIRGVAAPLMAWRLIFADKTAGLVTPQAGV